MNFKDRGITVGDLLIILIIILFSTILVKSFKKDNNTSLKLTNQEKIFSMNPQNQKSFRLWSLYYLI